MIFMDVNGCISYVDLSKENVFTNERYIEKML